MISVGRYPENQGLHESTRKDSLLVAKESEKVRLVQKHIERKFRTRCIVNQLGYGADVMAISVEDTDTEKKVAAVKARFPGALVHRMKKEDVQSHDAPVPTGKRTLFVEKPETNPISPNIQSAIDVITAKVTTLCAVAERNFGPDVFFHMVKVQRECVEEARACLKEENARREKENIPGLHVWVDPMTHKEYETAQWLEEERKARQAPQRDSADGHETPDGPGRVAA